MGGVFKAIRKWKGYREPVNRRCQSNLPQALVPNIVPEGRDCYLVSINGSGRLTKAYRLEQSQRIKQKRS